MTATIATAAAAAFAAGVAFGLTVEAWLLHRTTQRLQARIVELTRERNIWQGRATQLRAAINSRAFRSTQRRRHLRSVDN